MPAEDTPRSSLLAAMHDYVAEELSATTPIQEATTQDPSLGISVSLTSYVGLDLSSGPDHTAVHLVTHAVPEPRLWLVLRGPQSALERLERQQLAPDLLYIPRHRRLERQSGRSRRLRPVTEPQYPGYAFLDMSVAVSPMSLRLMGIHPVFDHMMRVLAVVTDRDLESSRRQEAESRETINAAPSPSGTPRVAQPSRPPLVMGDEVIFRPFPFSPLTVAGSVVDVRGEHVHVQSPQTPGIIVVQDASCTRIVRGSEPESLPRSP